MIDHVFGPPYVGVISGPATPVRQHKAGHYQGFAGHYRVTRLAYQECHEDIVSAIGHEKAIKHWPHVWKIDLIIV